MWFSSAPAAAPLHLKSRHSCSFAIPPHSTAPAPPLTLPLLKQWKFVGCCGCCTRLIFILINVPDHPNLFSPPAHSHIKMQPLPSPGYIKKKGEGDNVDVLMLLFHSPPFSTTFLIIHFFILIAAPWWFGLQLDSWWRNNNRSPPYPGLDGLRTLQKH